MKIPTIFLIQTRQLELKTFNSSPVRKVLDISGTLVSLPVIGQLVKFLCFHWSFNLCAHGHQFPVTDWSKCKNKIKFERSLNKDTVDQFQHY